MQQLADFAEKFLIDVLNDRRTIRSRPAADHEARYQQVVDWRGYRRRSIAVARRSGPASTNGHGGRSVYRRPMLRVECLARLVLLAIRCRRA